MKNLLRVPLCFCLVFVSCLIGTGCLKTRTDVKIAEEKKVLSHQMGSLQKNAADQQVRFQEVDQDLREIGGRVEVVEKRFEDQNREDTEFKKTIRKDIEEINKKVTILTEAIAKVEDRLVAMQRPSAKPKKKIGNFKSAQQGFKRKDWKTAIIGYQKYRELNPKGRRYTEATYKIGVSFQELGLKKEAKSFFQELVQKYPKSSYAKKAKYRLKQVSR